MQQLQITCEPFYPITDAPTSPLSVNRPQSAPSRYSKTLKSRPHRSFSFASIAQKDAPRTQPSISRRISFVKDEPHEFKRSVSTQKNVINLCETATDSPYRRLPLRPIALLPAKTGYIDLERQLPDNVLFHIADNLVKDPSGVKEITKLFLLLPHANKKHRYQPEQLQALIQSFLLAKLNRMSCILEQTKGNILDLPPIWLRAIQTIGPQVKQITCTKVALNSLNTRLIANCFTNLQNIQFNRCSVSDASLGQMGRLLKKSLTHLSFTACKGFTNQGVSFLRALEKLQSLAFIFCEVGLNDRAAGYIAQIKSLRALNLAGCRQITDNGLYQLATLPTLTDLNLNSCFLITDQGLAYFALPRTIQSLDLTFCKNLFQRDPNYLKRFQNLNSIVLRRIPNINSKLLQCFPLMQNLTHIDLRGTRLNKDITDEIDALTKRTAQLTISLK